MPRNVSKAPDYRERVAAYMTLLASEAAHAALGRWVDRDRLALELCRIWFDDVYVPSHRYFDGIKGDFSKEAADRFRGHFSDEELAELERFTRFLELRMEMLSGGRARATGRMPNDAGWQSLVRHAWYILDDLEPDGAYRRARLEERVEALSCVTVEDVARLLAASSEGLAP